MKSSYCSTVVGPTRINNTNQQIWQAIIETIIVSIMMDTNNVLIQ
jgi:hypothetical protein